MKRHSESLPALLALAGRTVYALGKDKEKMEVLVFILMIGIPTAIMIYTGNNKKRGCGGGCAACGNRKTCHRRKDQQ